MSFPMPRKFEQLIPMVVCVFALISPTFADDTPLPFPVATERGTTWFHGGDQINVTEVRGTSRQFLPGNTYRIKGEYRLLTHQQAEITACVQAPNGSTALVSGQQSVSVQQGDGDFSVLLPYPQTGTPHVAFSVNGENFGSLGLISAKFPFVCDYKRLGAQLNSSDDISIAQIRSSSKTMLPGSVIEITGTYMLASNGAARIAARLFHTASSPDQSQDIPIEQGQGQFTLILPVSGPGSLELLFLPNGSGGEPLGRIEIRLGHGKSGPSTLPSFLPGSPGSATVFFFLTTPGNTQFGFGNGDDPMKGSQVSLNFAMGTAKLADPVPTKFPYKVDFSTGLAEFPFHDSITINSVQGTNKKIVVGGWYKITGTFDFHSHEFAYFAAYVTQTEGHDDGIQDLPQQGVKLFPSGGTYTLILPVRQRGWPHVALYPLLKGGPNVETRYFGTGDTVLRDWNQAPPVD